MDSLLVLTAHLSALEPGVSRPTLHLKDNAKIGQNINIGGMSSKDLTSFNNRVLILSDLQNWRVRLC